MTRIMQHSFAAIVAILITAATFSEVVSVPAETSAPVSAALIA